MWTLFKREIQDTWGFLSAIAVIAVWVILYAELLARHDSGDFFKSGVYILGYSLLCLFLLASGSARMVVDHNQGISAFYAGHLATRGQVFIIRIAMGIFYVTLFFVPILHLFFREFILQTQWIQKSNDVEGIQRTLCCFSTSGWILIIVLFLLLPFSCYTLGLKTGQARNKIIPVFGALCLGVLLISFLIFKGIGIQAIILLAILNLSLIYSSWRQYATTSL